MEGAIGGGVQQRSPHFSCIRSYSCRAFFRRSSSRSSRASCTCEGQSALVSHAHLRTSSAESVTHLLGQLAELLRQFAAHLVQLPEGLCDTNMKKIQQSCSTSSSSAVN